MEDKKFLKSLKTCWSFLVERDVISQADVLFVFGRDDMKIPDKALELYEGNIAPEIVIMGGVGRLSGKLTEPESTHFRKYLIERGVPSEAIQVETTSTYTGENIDEGLKLINNDTKTIILITHAPHTKRTKAAARVRNEKIEFFSCPDDCKIDFNNSKSVSEGARECVEEIDRLIEYPKLGYIASVDIPKEVEEAHRYLKTKIAKQLINRF